VPIKTINPYCSSSWKKQFKKIPAFQNLINQHDHTIYCYKEGHVLKAALGNNVYARTQDILREKKVLDAQPYYYLQWLIEKQPQVILDVGCGINAFQCLWPNIIGIDDRSCPPPHDPESLPIHVDETFSLSHRHMCDALVSVNAIHFASLLSIPSKVRSLSQLVRPSGRVFLSFNVETWISATDKDDLKKLFGLYPDIDKILDYINQQILSLNLKLLVYDWPILSVSDCSPIRDEVNGNVRMVFEVDT
jgi:hypothetical protein